MKDTLHDEVAKVAYELHEKRGGAHGYDLDDWLEAERIVMERHAQSGKKKKSSKVKTGKGK